MRPFICVVFVGVLSIVSTPVQSAPRSSDQPCRVFVTEEKINSSWYVPVKDVNYGKKWYGNGDAAYQALAMQAWKLDADAVIAVDLRFRPSMWAWSSSHARGIAVKWNETGRANFASLKGQCYEQQAARK